MLTDDADFRPVRSGMAQIVYKKNWAALIVQPSLILFVFTMITCLLF